MADYLIKVSIGMSLTIGSLFKLVYESHFTLFKLLYARLVHVFLDVFACLSYFVSAANDELAIFEFFLIVLPNLVSFDKLLKLDKLLLLP